MAALVLTKETEAKCPNGGRTVVSMSRRVKLSQEPAALADEKTTMAPGCSLQVPCATVVTWVMPATRVTVEGKPALLATSSGVSQNGSPVGPGGATQTRVAGV